MKHCPECQQAYPDDVKFCRVDGTLLIVDLDSDAGTVKLPTSKRVDTTETRLLPTGNTQEKATSITDDALSAHTAQTTLLDPKHGSGKTKEVSKPKSRRTGIVMAAVVALALLAGLAYYFLYRKNTKSIESIAVLPFVNASGNQETEFLSDGISETLINNFTRIPTLRVIARSTAFRYKGKDIEPQTVGTELNVGAILTGKVLQRGDTLSVQVDLINAVDGTQIWGNQYNGKASEILNVQQSIARDVSEQLKLKLSGAQQQQLAKNYTTNPQAYEHYLKGRYYWNKRTAENFKKAILEFQAAADKDPNYAMAYVGLADTYLLLQEYAGMPSSDSIPQAKAYARRALEIDETLAEAHASLGLANTRLWQWAEAEKEFKRAIELNPNYPTAHHWYQVMLRYMGRSKEALAEIKRAQELDPLSNIINGNAVIAYLTNGDVDAAVEQAKKVIELDPNSWIGYSYLGRVYLKQGLNAEAVVNLEKAVELDGGSARSNGYLGHAYAVTGNRNKATVILKKLLERYAKQESAGLDIAAVYTGLGDRDAAFQWLEKDFQARNGLLPYINWEPIFEPLRNDPRYADLLRRIGLLQ